MSDNIWLAVIVAGLVALLVCVVFWTRSQPAIATPEAERIPYQPSTPTGFAEATAK